MSFVQKVKIKAGADNLTTVVTNMMADTRFTSAIDEMISVSKDAVRYAELSHNDSMQKFNAMCLSFFAAIKSKDKDEAIKHAKDLVKAGHGKAFGLA